MANYLSQLDHPYDTSIQGRLVNDTSIETGKPMTNWIHTESTCPVKTYYVSSYQTCFDCPTTNGVYFQQESLEFTGISGGDSTTASDVSTSNNNNNNEQTTILMNDEEFPVEVVLKSLPPFIEYRQVGSSNHGFGTQQKSITIQAGSSLPLVFQSNTKDLNAGTAIGEVSVSISDGGYYPGCVGTDVKFTVSVHVRPVSELNLLGWIAYIGWILSCITFVTSLEFARWCYKNRGHRVLDAMQPTFLLGVCLGVIILGSALVPMSIDDGIVSVKGCNVSCMATPWLLSVGFTVAFSAIFSKLMRINKMVANLRAFRRVRIMEHDVLGPFIVLFILNVSIMTAWTIIDPLKWVRIPHDDQPWNSYGACRGSNSKAAAGFWSAIGVINLGSLTLACYQAYLSRKLSDDYSESKSIGFAIFSWFQLSVVGIPVLVLLDDGNVAKHALQVFLLFAVCMSLLLSIFVPIIKHYQKVEYQIRHGGPDRRLTDSLRVTGMGEISFKNGSRISSEYASRDRSSTKDILASGDRSSTKNILSRSYLITDKNVRAPKSSDPELPESAIFSNGVYLTSTGTRLDILSSEGRVISSFKSEGADLEVIDEEEEDGTDASEKKPNSTTSLPHRKYAANKSSSFRKLKESASAKRSTEEVDPESQLMTEYVKKHGSSFLNSNSGDESFWKNHKTNEPISVPSWALGADKAGKEANPE